MARVAGPFLTVRGAKAQTSENAAVTAGGAARPPGAGAPRLVLSGGPFHLCPTQERAREALEPMICPSVGRVGRTCALAATLLVMSRPLTAQDTMATAGPARDSIVHAGQHENSTDWSAWILGTQINVIAQHLAPFESNPYSGPNSLVAGGDSKVSSAFGVYLGARVVAGAQVYLDLEMIRGGGISGVTGLGGITNGDVLRQGSVDLGQGPYVARAFLRYAIPIGHGPVDTLAPSPDQIPMLVRSSRIEITVGRLALNDLMDVNRYATSTRLEFQNWGLWQNTAWDFAADTRGYSNGIALALIQPRWAFRAATFQMPEFANGNVYDGDVRQDRGDEAELTLVPGRRGTVIRLLGYVNHARMGDYEEALRKAEATGTTPDIVADDQPGRSKSGFGVNLEQPLADGGETGVFARYGWNDGKTESFAFTEVDHHTSLGLQLSGAHWRRVMDQVGLGLVRHGLSTPHRNYLEAGGSGFLLGDGRLNYRPEQIVELYYRLQVGPFLQLSPDFQHAWNPGYNRDRGPATVYAFRVNFRY